MADDVAAPVSLPTEINIATRALHTELNRLIVARLPLALPPFADDATLYSRGLLHFAHIYLTFECLWADLTSTAANGTQNSPPTSPLLSFLLVNPYAEPELFTSPPGAEMVAFLKTLRPKGLARSGRLRRDLALLTGLHPTDLDVLLAQYPGDKVAEYCAHIRSSVGNKPHVLVAYAWTFYMAIFSGGRWIRGELLKAGPAYWNANVDNAAQGLQASQRLQQEGLSFWSFPGVHDGLDVKEAFKMQLAAAETLLTPDQRVDIIEEAKAIFKLSATLVHELDEQLGTDAELLKRPPKVDIDHARPQAKANGSPAKPANPAKLSRPDIMWLQRLEVTGAVVAVSCLACAVWLRLGY